MMNFNQIMSGIGCRVSVSDSSGIVQGRGVIYPLRYQQRQWGVVSQPAEGITQEQRFLLFCDNELLCNAGYGSVITDENGNRYRLVWKDDYTCTVGAYTKACMRRMTKEEEQVCE